MEGLTGQTKDVCGLAVKRDSERGATGGTVGGRVLLYYLPWSVKKYKEYKSLVSVRACEWVMSNPIHDPHRFEGGLTNGERGGIRVLLTVDEPTAVSVPGRGAPTAHNPQMFHTFPRSVARPHRVHAMTAIIEEKEALGRCEGTIKGAWLTHGPASIERALAEGRDVVQISKRLGLGSQLTRVESMFGWFDKA